MKRLDFILVNEENKDALNFIKKLTNKEIRSGQIIMVTKSELETYGKDVIKVCLRYEEEEAKDAV
jgi:hypothetical protein